MAPFTARLPVRPDQDVDLIIKIVGPPASGLVKDWTFIAQFPTQKGLSVMTRQGRLNGEFGKCVLDIGRNELSFVIFTRGHAFQSIS